MSKIKQVTAKTNLIDWAIYSIAAAILLLPFLGGQNLKHFSASLIIGFLFGMINRIIREIVILRKQLKGYDDEQ